jgi:hypothetical protein
VLANSASPSPQLRRIGRRVSRSIDHCVSRSIDHCVSRSIDHRIDHRIDRYQQQQHVTTQER